MPFGAWRSGSVVTGVKSVLHLGYVDDADIGGQPLIQRAQDRVHWSETRLNARFWTEPQVGHLSPGMDPGVSASGALDVDGSPEEILGGFAKLALDGARIGLLLPAAVFGSVVLQGKFPGFQDPSLAVRQRPNVMMSATRASDRGGVNVQRL
jgi:hypothetical protein